MLPAQAPHWAADSGQQDASPVRGNTFSTAWESTWCMGWPYSPSMSWVTTTRGFTCRRTSATQAWTFSSPPRALYCLVRFFWKLSRKGPITG